MYRIFKTLCMCVNLCHFFTDFTKNTALVTSLMNNAYEFEARFRLRFCKLTAVQKNVTIT